MKPAVLFVHSNTELYGADFILSEVVDALRDQVTPIVALPGPGELTDRLSRAGVRVIYTRESVLRRVRFKPHRLPGLLWNVLADTRRLVEIVRQENVKLIYSNTSAVITGALAARVCRIPNMYHVHEIIENPAWLAKAIARIVVGNASEVIAVSGPVRDFLSHYGRLGDPPVSVIHNGLEPYDSQDAEVVEAVRAELGAEPDNVLYGVIGRIHPWKGQRYFLDAARMVADVLPQARFVIIGGTFPGYESLLEELKKRVLRLELENVLKILPYRRDIAPVMRALDVLVLPSIKPDPLPTVVLEAMASQRPVIATAHGGSLEMVEHGHTGFLAPHHDVTGLAEAMIDLAGDAALRQSFGLAGRERLAAEFSRDRFRDEIRRCVQGHLAVVTDAEMTVNNHTQRIH
jgi:glycosyltransferase involved in cell wall biosynthesis